MILAGPNVGFQEFVKSTVTPAIRVNFMVNSETVRQLALEMPNTSERSCYGTPGFYVGRKLFARLLEDGDSVVVKIEFADRERRMKADPKTFFITDHYLNYPMMIIRLSSVDVANFRELLDDAWNLANN